MKKDDQLPTPEDVARELGEMREAAKRISKEYKEVYVAALRGNSGSSLGQLGTKGQGSDPTANAAFAPDKRQLRYAAREMKRAIRRAHEALERAEERGWKVFQELPGGAMRDEYERRRDARREWRLHRWEQLECGCAKDSQGWWLIAQRCTTHVGMIPDLHRVPFLEVKRTPPPVFRLYRSAG